MLRQEMKIYAVIVAIYPEYNIFEVANFSNVAKSFVSFGLNWIPMAGMYQRTKHSKTSDTI